MAAPPSSAGAVHLLDSRSRWQRIALVSGATLAAAGGTAPDGTALEHLGDVPVRGREGKVEVYRLAN